MSLYHISLPGRSFVTLHRPFRADETGAVCLAAKHYPLPSKPIREWLAERRRDGHLAHAGTPIKIMNGNLFANLPLSPALPHIGDGAITYLFADRSVAVLFKLTFGGIGLASLQNVT